MNSIYDEDEIKCPRCGHIGVLPDGSFSFECPACGHEFDILPDEDENEDEEDED